MFGKWSNTKRSLFEQWLIFLNYSTSIDISPSSSVGQLRPPFRDREFPVGQKSSAPKIDKLEGLVEKVNLQPQATKAIP